MRRTQEYEYDGDTGEVTGGKVSMFEDEMVENGTVKVSNSNGGGDMLDEIQNGFPEPSDCPKSVRPNTFAEDGKTDGTGTNEVKMQDQKVVLKKLKLNLSEEMLDELLGLQEKGIDIDVLFKEFLRNREEKIAERKEEITREVVKKEEKRYVENKEPSRYVSVKTKRILHEEYGTKCSVGGCGKAAVHLHHTVPFSMGKSNSPDLLRPLCRAHHDILHSMNTVYVRKKFEG